jgi:peptide/nickel transport system permease protein
MTTGTQTAPPLVFPLSSSAPRRGPWSSGLQRVIHSPTGAAGVVVLLVLSVLVAGAPLFSPFPPLEQHRGQALLAPGVNGYLLGTDEFGRDLFSRILWGGRISFVVALLSVGIGSAAGVAIGLVAGYFGGRVDALIMRVCDMILSFPGILVAVAVVSVLGPGSINVAWALAVGITPGIARLTRSSVLREREHDYVLAARCTGASHGRIMWRHIFPNTVAPLLVQVSLALSFVVLAEASLSFLGLGTQPPDPSWGGMLNTSRAHLREDAWYGIFPGVALALLVFGLNSFSDALRDALDPRRAGRAL